ncbi:hypothetical protein NQD34_000584 [Periophthalmus magnuspinnatus]|nr:hypothetical protein NQD34_000584 [Periophthalmus magnuspinnatus]
MFKTQTDLKHCLLCLTQSQITLRPSGTALLYSIQVLPSEQWHPNNTITIINSLQTHKITSKSKYSVLLFSVELQASLKPGVGIPLDIFLAFECQLSQFWSLVCETLLAQLC